MKTQSHPYMSRLMTRSMGAFFALACLPAFAGFIDSFNSKTGWKDTLNGGSANVASGVFTITSAAAPGLTYSIKTNVTVSTTTTNTLELRVLVKGLAPGSPAYNGNAVLGWVPNGGALLANGYALVVGATNIQIYKDSTVLYGTNLAAPIQASDLTKLILVLRMTYTNSVESGDSTTSHIRASVYRNVNTTFGFNNGTVLGNLLFEYTVNDPGTYELGAGNPALGSQNSPSGAASVVSFDDLQSYDVTYFPPTTSTLLDNFSGPHSPLYSDFVPGGPASPITQAGGVLRMDMNIPLALSAVLMGSKLNAPTFRIADGVRIEARVKVVDQGDDQPPGTARDNNPLSGIAIFGYFPDPGTADFSTLNGYFLVEGSMWTNNTGGPSSVPPFAKDAGYVFGGKSSTVAWVSPNFFPTFGSAGAGGQYVSTNVEFIQIFTGEGNAVRIEQRVEDLSKDVNDPNRIVYQIVALDDGSTFGPSYANKDGTFALINYRASGGNTIANKDNGFVIWDNLVVGQTTPVTPPPNITTNYPDAGSAFGTNTSCQFSATHPSAVPTNNMVLTLNGVRYTNGYPNCTVRSSATGFQTNMTLTLANLSPDTLYVGTISATSDGGKNTTLPFSFDTFRDDGVHSKVIESEDYNFNGGSYIDPNILVAQGNTFGCSGGGPGYTGCAYNGQAGLEGTDMHDAQTAAPGIEGERVYRDPVSDPVRTMDSSDPARAKYVANGGPSSGFFEVMVGGQNREIANGDWLNYTRLTPAGTYNAYMRMSTYSGGSSVLFLSQSQVSLNLVTSDPTMPSQTIALLGSFYQLSDAAGDTGSDRQRTVPLSDVAGNRLVVRLGAPPTTLRVGQDVVRASEGQVNENYIVLVPVPDPGKLRPIVSSVSPAPNSTTRIDPVSAVTQAVLANRDTAVDTTKIVLKLNGVPVATTVTAGGGGATVSWSPAATPATPTINASLTYADNDTPTPVTNTVSWSYSYPFLFASNSFPVGFLSARGITNRTAWSFNNGNTLGSSLARAEQQLSIPPQIPLDTYAEGIISMMNWDDNECAAGTLPPGVTCVMGLETGGPYDNIACESSGYMHLTAGFHRWVVTSDDGFQIRSGSAIEDLNATVMGYRDGGTFSGTFDFNVEAEGLYPMRSIWYENGGYADYHVSSRDPNGVNPDALVNDPGNPAGVVEVYLPTQPDVLLYASSAATGPYTLISTATIDTVNKQITVAMSGARQFYRLSSATVATITSVTRSGGNIVIKYTK